MLVMPRYPPFEQRNFPVNRTIVLLLSLITLFAGWRLYESSKPAQNSTASAAVLAPAPADRKICFVPIGGFPVDQLETLSRYYKEKYKVEISLAKTVTIDPAALDSSRHQLMAEDLAASLRHALPEYDVSTILVGFTSEDIYPVSQNWKFAFGWRRTAERAAVVSTARLSLRYPGGPDDADISTTRMRKIVTKDIGILYFGLPQSSNPKSVLYNQIMGIQELDEVGEDF
jgi:predicted Zn-dependent protease